MKEEKDRKSRECSLHTIILIIPKVESEPFL